LRVQYLGLATLRYVQTAVVLDLCVYCSISHISDVDTAPFAGFERGSIVVRGLAGWANGPTSRKQRVALAQPKLVAAGEQIHSGEACGEIA
jgi:hypothetical protein